MALTTFGFNDPFFGQMERALDRAFTRALGERSGDVMGAFMPALTGPSSAGGHPMDIVETNDAFLLTTDAPGFNPDDIKVEMADGVLTVSGKRAEEKVDEQQGKLVRRERHFATFTRSFTMPDNVKEDGITARLDKGVLHVSVPKTEPAPKPAPKRIAVASANE